MASWSGPDPKPEKRQKATRATQTAYRARFEGHPCAACEKPYETLHHIVPRSQGGDDVPDNLVPLCGDGTRGCHGRLESHAPGWEKIANGVRVYVLNHRNRCQYVIRKIGWDRFNKRYPLLSEPEGHGTQGDPATTPAVRVHETASGSESNQGTSLPPPDGEKLTRGASSLSGAGSDWPERRHPWEIHWESRNEIEGVPF